MAVAYDPFATELRDGPGVLTPELAHVKRDFPRRELLDSFLVRGPRRLELRPVA